MQQCFRFQDSRAAYEQIEDEVLAIDLQTGAYYSLRELAAVIWLAAVQGAATDAIAAALSAQYTTVAADILQRDVESLLSGLVDVELLTPATSADAPAPVLESDLLPAVYAAPTFERYDDMQALLLLDPIHDVDLSGWPMPLESDTPNPEPTTRTDR